MIKSTIMDQSETKNKKDIRLLRVKDEIDKVLSSIEPDVFDYKKSQYLPLGKAIRSRFSFLMGDSLAVQEDKSLDLAFCSEIVHNASLLHDDCVDEAIVRRGKPTVNSTIGINRAILLGDLTMVIAFNRAERISSEVASQLVFTVRKMVEGAMLEENSKWKIIDEKTYKRIVSGKTSALFRWISVSSAFLQKERIFEKVVKISENFGLAFQIIDDIIDIENCSDSGKECFKDILEGKITMPTILALNDEKFADLNRSELNEFFSQPLKDHALAMKIALRIKDCGYTMSARKKAETLIESIREDVLSLPQRNHALELYGFMIGLCQRNR